MRYFLVRPFHDRSGRSTSPVVAGGDRKLDTPRRFLPHNKQSCRRVRRESPKVDELGVDQLRRCFTDKFEERLRTLKAVTEPSAHDLSIFAAPQKIPIGIAQAAAARRRSQLDSCAGYGRNCAQTSTTDRPVTAPGHGWQLATARLDLPASIAAHVP